MRRPTEYTYDSAGNRLTLKDGNAHVTTYHYDLANRLITESDALAHTTTYGYDALGNRVTTLDAKGQLTQLVYDGLNRLTLINYPAPEADVTLTYNERGEHTQMTDGLGVTAFDYDQLSRPIAITDPFTGTVNYSYDAMGNRTQLEYPDGKTVAYTYDPINRLTQVNASFLTTPVTYTYDVANRLTDVVLPNGLTSAYSLSNPVNYTDPSGLMAIRPWDEYLAWPLSFGVDIADERGNGVGSLNPDIARRTIAWVVRNFERGPSRGPNRSPYDVQCYDSIKLYMAPPLIYNQYDYLFSGWVDYWAWRAERANQPVVVKDPNLIKAISYRESGVGNDTSVPFVGFTDYALINTLRGQRDPDTLQQYGMTWGFYNYVDRGRDKSQEVGGAVRWLYAAYFKEKSRPSQLNTPEDVLWRNILQSSYGPHQGTPEGDKQYSPCYGQEIWDIYTRGKFSHNCDPNTPDRYKTYTIVWTPSKNP